MGKAIKGAGKNGSSKSGAHKGGLSGESCKHYTSNTAKVYMKMAT